MTEHPLWIDSFRQIRPTFKLPCRKSISTVYVDKVYAEMQSSITHDLLEANDLHIQLDGWTNINNDGIINFVICKPEPLFVKFLNTKDNRHTAEYLKNRIVEIIETYGKEKFFVIIGDNAANVKKSFELVKNVYKGYKTSRMCSPWFTSLMF
uniref:DUF659 domain-containing protein n=2 Tax=Sipha flava TaxID=143950 RepID=A0A2S2PV19_9HEMI